MEALVLSSGGLDSATCLALAAQRYGGGQVLALSIFYGQRHRRELTAARQLAEYYGAEHRQLDLTQLFQDSACSLLAHSGREIPHASYQEQLEQTGGSPVSTYVPFRNGLFLSCAAAVALSKGCQVVYYGAHGDDAAGNAYPDTSQAFHRAMDQAVQLGSGGEVRLEAPFIRLHKADVVALGTKLGVPFELTWSCYEGGQRPCGLCGTCRDRLRAFAENGLTDPLVDQGEAT
ncbi:MAG: 7-cyano-7-deazaguanine synthase QueC [Oscillospiraceae bacterium]|nr:7-cyano-7-deazaguanine synthase QueC [Oscillospiraceae bacterium]